MAALSTFFETMANHVVLLILLLPIVGAGLVRLLAKAGREAAYFTAIMNAWITISLAGVMVMHFDTNPDRESPYQMVSSLGWTIQRERVPVSTVKDESSVEREFRQTRFSGPDVRLAVGVDSLSLWFVLLVVVGNVAAIYSIPFSDENLVPRLSWTLLAEAAMVGSFAALDAVMLCFVVGVSVWCLFLLIGLSGQSDRREVARRFFRLHAFSTAILMLGLVGLCVSFWWMRMTPSGPKPDLTFSLERVVWGIGNVVLISPYAADFWPSVAPWLFTLVVLAATFRAALPPFHHWWYRVAQQADRSVLVLLLTGFMPFGFYLAHRVSGVVFVSMSERLAPYVSAWGTVGAAFIALGALSLSNLVERVSAAALVVLTAVFAFSFAAPSVLLNGMSLLLIASLGTAAAFLVLVPRELLHRPLDRIQTGEPLIPWPSWHRWLAYVSLAGLMHLPFSGVFWGDLVLLVTVFPKANGLTYVLIVSFALVSIAMVEPIRCVQAWTCPTEERFRVTRVGLVPLMVLLLILGLVPNWISQRLPQSPPAEVDR